MIRTSSESGIHRPAGQNCQADGSADARRSVSEAAAAYLPDQHRRMPSATPEGKNKFTLRLSNEDEGTDDADSGLATVTAKPKLQRPAMYKVILLNDDYTPMEFVVHVLEVFFGIAREKATQIMLAVHTQGAAVVGIYPRDIAETKSEQVNQYSQENNHPLISTVEMTD